MSNQNQNNPGEQVQNEGSKPDLLKKRPGEKSVHQLTLQDAFADLLRLRVADSFGCSDQYSVHRRLHVLKRIAWRRRKNWRTRSKNPVTRGYIERRLFMAER